MKLSPVRLARLGHGPRGISRLSRLSRLPSGPGERGTGGEVFIIDVRVDDPCALCPFLLVKHVRYITIPTPPTTIPTP